jgi:hypothetical protein
VLGVDGEGFVVIIGFCVVEEGRPWRFEDPGSGYPDVCYCVGAKGAGYFFREVGKVFPAGDVTFGNFDVAVG